MDLSNSLLLIFCVIFCLFLDFVRTNQFQTTGLFCQIIKAVL